MALLLATICHHTQSQTVSENINRFSDLHIHSSLKSYYRNVPHPDSALKGTDNLYGTKNWTLFEASKKDKLSGKESNLANYDQAGYANLKGLNGSVLCLSVTPMEKAMLTTSRDRWLNYKAGTRIPIKRQEVIVAKDNSPFKEFMGEYSFTAQQDSVHDGMIRLARNNSDLKRIVGKNGIGVVLTIEGGHTLFGSNISSDLERTKSSGCDAPCRAEILDNIDKLHQLPHRVFFMTLAHFGWNKMVGNSKSLDKPGLRRGMLTMASLSDDFKNAVLAKHGEGIIGRIHEGPLTDTSAIIHDKRIHIKMPYAHSDAKSDLGFTVINKLLDTENDYKNPIYIDVKHLDLMARFQYYTMIDSLNKIRKAEGKKLIPIIASHVGLSGKKRPVAFATELHPLNNSYEELIFGPVFYKVQRDDHDAFWRAYTSLLPASSRRFWVENYNPEIHGSFNPFVDNINFNNVGWFYPWGINLCDEEIKHIYASDGIIGIILDRRVLGFYMSNYSRRYKKNLRQKFLNVYEDNKIKTGNATITFDDYYLSEPLLRNILHVIEECGVADATAWEHIAIGSDYDGFIQPIHLAPTTESIPAFHKKMVACLKAYIAIHNKKDLLYGLSPEKAMDNFFYLNGRNFIFKYFQD